MTRYTKKPTKQPQVCNLQKLFFRYLDFSMGSRENMHSSKKILNKTGALLIKTFTNQNLKTLKKSFENTFEQVFVEKPQASKTSSAEVYLLGLIPK